MVDVNNTSRKRKSSDEASELNEDEVSTSTLQPSTVECQEPAVKMVKSEDVTNDSETLSENVVTNDVSTAKIDEVSDREKVLILDEEIVRLKNELLEANSKVCNCNANGKVNNLSEDNDPVITIKFHNQSIAESYKNKFIHFLKSIKEFIHVNTDLEIIISKNGLDKDGNPHNENNRKRKRKKSKTDKADLFVLDTTPSEECVERFELKYTSKYSVQTEEKVVSNKNNASLCFNCNKNHNLRDCPEPKDYNKINAARMKMKSNHVVKNRYHMEEDQKYAHFTPGKISDQLKEALGLHKNELPPYIYKMRLFGYPPGWLEDAKIEHSNISLYNIEGKEDCNGKNKLTTNINVDRIVEYPGFNMPIEDGFKDEYKLHDCPPFSDRCSKEAMINFLKESYQKEQDNNETCDMDLDNSTDDSTVPPGCEEVFSQSLIDLEKKKLELLAELDIGGNNSELEQEKDVGKSELEDVNINNDKDTDEKIESNNQIAEEVTINTPTPNGDGSPIKDNVKLSVFGTPIIESTSPYCVLPDSDKFSKDISPMINFENLPNSTGKYEQMTMVLQKVRKTLKEISDKEKP